MSGCLGGDGTGADGVGAGLARTDHALFDEDVERLVAGWTAEEVLAIHDFLQRMAEALWERHQEAVMEHLYGLDEPEPPERSANLELALEEPEQPF